MNQPRLNAIINKFNETTGETYVASTVTGYPRRFTAADDLTTVDGENYTAAAKVALAIMAINDLLAQAVAHDGPDKTAQAFPQYVCRIVATGAQVAADNNEFSIEVPTNHGWPLAARLVLGIGGQYEHGYDVVRDGSFRLLNNTYLTGNAETASNPVGYVAAETGTNGAMTGKTLFVIAFRDGSNASVDLAPQKITYYYLALQEDVTGGSTVDVRMPAFADHLIVARMKQLADLYKT